MSSRILGGANLASVEEVVWPEIGAAPKPAAPRRTAGPAAHEAAAPAAAIEILLAERVAAEHDAAYRKGESDGFQRAKQELAPLMERLARSIAEIAALRPRIRREAERELVELAVLIARRVLRRELTVDPDAISGLLRAALDKTTLREAVEVRTHPEHRQAIEHCLRALGSPVSIAVRPDPRLERGAVLVETLHGEIDASLETQLAEIERGMADLLESPGGSR